MVTYVLVDALLGYTHELCRFIVVCRCRQALADVHESI